MQNQEHVQTEDTTVNEIYILLSSAMEIGRYFLLVLINAFGLNNSSYTEQLFYIDRDQK